VESGVVAAMKTLFLLPVMEACRPKVYIDIDIVKFVIDYHMYNSNNDMFYVYNMVKRHADRHY